MCWKGKCQPSSIYLAFHYSLRWIEAMKGSCRMSEHLPNEDFSALLGEETAYGATRNVVFATICLSHILLESHLVTTAVYLVQLFAQCGNCYIIGSQMF